VAPTWILFGDAFSQALPLLAALRARHGLGRARLGILVWSVLLLGSNVLSYVLSSQRRNNHWLGYLFDPVMASVLLWTFSLWQTQSVPRIALRLLIPIFLVATVTLTLTIEDLGSFSRITETFTDLLLLGVSLYTLLIRSLAEQNQLTRADWFWVSGAVALFYGSDTALEPLARVLLNGRQELILVAFEVKAAIGIVVSLAIARGLLCHNPPLNSGGSSSLASSPWSSSSRPSGQPS